MKGLRDTEIAKGLNIITTTGEGPFVRSIVSADGASLSIVAHSCENKAGQMVAHVTFAHPDELAVTIQALNSAWERYAAIWFQERVKHSLLNGGE